MKALIVLLVFMNHVSWGIAALSDTPRYYQLNWREFYESAEANQVIDIIHPDYHVLDAALFHASNKAREKENMPAFIHSNNFT